MRMLNQKVVLITGASSGVGQSTARLLSQKGYRVFETSRNPASAQATLCAKARGVPSLSIPAVMRLSVDGRYTSCCMSSSRDQITLTEDFLTLWKDADSDIPIYQQARAEYAKIKP